MKIKIYFVILLCITISGFILRFWNYPERFGLAYDQAHDAVVAREAIRQLKIPLVGPFSSAGPFQTSGTWYWLLMIGTALYPVALISPWIFLTALCGLLIPGLGLLGKKMEESNVFGIILAIFAAISTAFIAQSVNLTNQTPLSVFSFLTIVSCLWYMKKKTMLSAFSLGFFASFGASIHLQGMALAIPVLLAFLLGGKMKIHLFLVSLFGAFLPMSPILLWDLSNDFVNIKNMIYYYRYDQFNISLDVLGRRWLTYLSEFWPKEWAHIIGGYPAIAIILVIGAIVFFLYQLITGKLKKQWFFIFLSFGLMTVLVRYTRVPLFASFITFTHPFVILLASWAVYQVYRVKRHVGIVLFITVISLTMVKTGKEVFTQRENYAINVSESIRLLLVRTYPNETFRILDWKYDEAAKSLPLVLYLDEKHLISDGGRAIGISKTPQSYILETDVISSASGYITDLSSKTSAYLARDGWKFVNPSFIYRETEEWRE